MNSVSRVSERATPAKVETSLPRNASPLQRHAWHLDQDLEYAIRYEQDPETFEEEIRAEQQAWEATQRARELVEQARRAERRKRDEEWRLQREAAQTKADEEWQAIEADYDKEHEAREPSPCDVYGGDGEFYGAPQSLPDFVISVDPGVFIRADEGDKLTKLINWCQREGRSLPEPRRGSYVERSLHWALSVDQGRTVPLGLKGAALASWCAEWRDNIPDLRGVALGVYATEGENPVFVTWSDEPRSAREVRDWCKRISHDADAERFTAVRGPWWVPCEGLYLPSAHASPAVLAKACAPATSTAGATLDVGIDELQRQFRAGGLPLGARVVIGGQTGQGKTTLALHLAETAAAQRWFVVWLAYDEGRDEILIRRLQRQGLPPAVAQTLPVAALAGLDAVDLYVETPEHPFEEYARQTHEQAGGRPVLFVVDSIQKLVTAAGAGRGERERITAAVDAIQDCQRRFPSVVVMTSEIARGSGATKGSGSIDFGATLDLRVRRQSTKLAVQVQKNRHGSEESFELQIDQERQRLRDPKAAAQQAASAALRAKILEAVAALGAEASSTKKIEAQVKARNLVVRATIKAMVADGALAYDGTVYRCV